MTRITAKAKRRSILLGKRKRAATSKRSAQLRVVEAHCLQDVLDAVSHAKAVLDLQRDEEFWYRGVSSRRHQLLPSLLRSFEAGDRTHEKIVGRENDLFFEFMAKARTREGVVLNEFDVLFLMQHYGAPTRLLDWTGVLYIAIYFALAYRDRSAAEPPRVYVMNPYLWNDEHGYGRDLWWPRYLGWDEEEQTYYDYGELLIEGGADWEHPLALYPPQREDRLSAQRGYFTIHGIDSRPLDEIRPDLVLGIDLEPRAVSEAIAQLEYSGISEYTLFPDLAGLARQLRDKYCPR